MVGTDAAVAAWTWSVIGLAGQALFTLRNLHQWVSSERARRSLVPTSFWLLSIAGNLLLTAHTLIQRSPVFFFGQLLSLLVSLRLYSLARSARPLPRVSTWLLPPSLIVGVAIVSGALTEHHSFLWNGWGLLGMAGQCLWSSRFYVLWWQAENQRQRQLTASFFLVGTAGTVLLTAYAAHLRDVVMLLAYAFTPVPFLRNLVLLARSGRGSAASRPDPRLAALPTCNPTGATHTP